MARQTHRVALKSLSMKELIRTTDPTVIPYVTALLEGEGIALFVMDVHMSALEGSIGILPRRVMVRDQDLADAQVILRDNNIAIEG